MRLDVEEVAEKAKSLGLNVVGCKAKDFAHRTDYTLFLVENRSEAELLAIAAKTGLICHPFIQMGKFRHKANTIINLSKGLSYKGGLSL